MQNKRGLSTFGVILIIAAIIVVAGLLTNWTFSLSPSAPAAPAPNPQGPSSQLTNVYINSLDAMAATTTSAPVTAYVFSSDGSTFLSSASLTSSSAAFTVPYGGTYQVITLNTTAGNGYYPQTFTINANAPAIYKNIMSYKTGTMGLYNLSSSVDPAGKMFINPVAGSTCGFVLTFADNTTASGYNSPLIMCQVNVSSVTGVNIPAQGMGIVAANALAPSRVSATSGYTYYTFNLPKMVLSTDGTYKVTGTETFSATTAPAQGDTMSCKIVDQQTWINSNYNTMSLSQGFQTAAQNQQTLADIGAPDSNSLSLTYNGTATTYC